MHMPLRPFNPGEKVDNADGSYSTERTVTVQTPDGAWVNVPSLWMGPNGPVDLRSMGDDYIGKIAGMWESQSGNKFTRFNDLNAAEAAAKQRSASGGAGSPMQRYQNQVAQKQPSDTQLEAAQRILSYGHKRTYAYGAQGATVRALQIYLASQGYPVGKFDGVWGRKTQRAFENFEKDKGQSFGQKASPKALRFISAEIAPPIPQQNPRDVPPAPPQPPQLDGGAMPAAQIPSVSPTSVPNSPPPAPPPAPRMPFDDVAQPQPGDPNFSTDLHAQIMKGFSVPWEGQAPADRTLMDQGNQDRAFQAQVQTAADRSMGNSPLAGPTPSYRMSDMPPQAPSSLRDALLNPQAFMPQTPGDGMDKLREALLRKLVPVDMAGR